MLGQISFRRKVLRQGYSSHCFDVCGRGKGVIAAPRAGRVHRILHKRPTYDTFIYRVLKQVHPDMGVSSKAMTIVSSLVNGIFERIAAQASRLAQVNVDLPRNSHDGGLPGELAIHAVSEGTRAVTKSIPICYGLYEQLSTAKER